MPWGSRIKRRRRLGGYTVPQVAKLLQLHPDTVRKYIHSGSLPATKISVTGRAVGRWRILGLHLSGFLEKNPERLARIPERERPGQIFRDRRDRTLDDVMTIRGTKST